MKEKYKVIIWGLGSVGRSALEIINAKKSLELAAVYDIDPKKIGKDAGEVCGFEKAGIVVSNDREEVLNTEADIALYYAASVWNEGKLPDLETCDSNVKDIIDLLEHGKNVTTTVNVYFSQKNQPRYFEMIDAAAKKGGVTYTQQGIFPGFFTPYLPTVFGMLNRRVEKVIVHGGQDDSANTAPWVNFLCYGKTVEDIPAMEFAFLKSLFFTYYGPTCIEITERLGLEYDEYRCDVTQIMADEEIVTPNAHIKPGTIGTHRFIMATYNKGEEVVGFHFNHKGSNEILMDYTVDKMIEIFGEPYVKVEMQGIIDHFDPFLTSASPNVNLIPSIVDARPGYINALDLPVGYLPK